MRNTTIATSTLVRAANALAHVASDLTEQYRNAIDRAPEELQSDLLAELRRTQAAEEDLRRAAREQQQ